MSDVDPLRLPEDLSEKDPSYLVRNLLLCADHFEKMFRSTERKVLVQDALPTLFPVRDSIEGEKLITYIGMLTCIRTVQNKGVLALYISCRV